MHFKQRAAIFVDGSNLYHSLRKVLGKDQPLLDFDYRKLTDACVSSTHQIIYRNYYLGKLAFRNDPVALPVYHSQKRLFQHLLSSEQRFVIREGSLRVTNGVYYEKGVDVLLAIDLVIGALRDEFDVAVLISSDSDMIPAVQFLRSIGKEVIYVAFEGRRTIGLSKKASKTLVWNKTGLQPFL